MWLEMRFAFGTSCRLLLKSTFKHEKKKKSRRGIVFLKRQHFINSLAVDFNTHQLHSTPRRTFCRTSEVGSGLHEPCANTFARNNDQGSSLKEFSRPEQPLMRGGQGAEPGPGVLGPPGVPVAEQRAASSKDGARAASVPAAALHAPPRPAARPRPQQTWHRAGFRNSLRSANERPGGEPGRAGIGWRRGFKPSAGRLGLRAPLGPEPRPR